MLRTVQLSGYLLVGITIVHLQEDEDLLDELLAVHAVVDMTLKHVLHWWRRRI